MCRNKNISEVGYIQIRWKKSLHSVCECNKYIFEMLDYIDLEYSILPLHIHFQVCIVI